MKKIFLVITLLFLISGTTFSQDKTEKIKRSDCKYHIGATGGNSMGYGLSFLYQVKRTGFQVTYSPYFRQNKVFSSASVTFLYLLKKSKNINFMTYLSENLAYEFSNNSVDYNYENLINKTGVGFALQFYLSTKVKLSLYSGYSFQYKKNENSSFSGSNNYSEMILSPDGGVSLYFMF